MGATDRARADFRQADVSDLAGFDEIRHGTDGIFDRGIRIQPMLIIQVDIICAQAAKRTLYGPLDMSRTAVQAEHLAVWTELHADFLAVITFLPRFPLVGSPERSSILDRSLL